MLITGIKHKYSSSYHPQSNSASEHTNKTLTSASASMSNVTKLVGLKPYH